MYLIITRAADIPDWQISLISIESMYVSLGTLCKEHLIFNVSVNERKMDA